MPRNTYYLLLTLSFISLIIYPSLLIARDEKETIYHVIDGNTLHNGKRKVFLYGIDAPELEQTCLKDQKVWKCGLLAKRHLRDLIRFQPVECKIDKIDKLNRYLSTCYVRGRNINQKMVRDGWATAYSKHTKRYAKDEEEAKYDRIGIWTSLFHDFESWRKLNPSPYEIRTKDEKK